jgi:hypothetical protein
MKYYEWWGDLASTGIRFPARHFNGWWMVEGHPVTGWQETLIANYSSAEVLSSNFGLARNSWPVASLPMRVFFETHFPGLMQFLPFRLQRPDGSGEVRGFSVCQVLKSVPCLDRSRTKVSDKWEPINEFGDFDLRGPAVLDRALIGDERLFRIKGESTLIVIREDLKAAMESVGFKEQRFDFLECNE